MANIQSQIKRNRQNERRRERNLTVRTRLKTEAKKVREAGPEDAQPQLKLTASLIDKAASKGVIHKRTAARRKSRLAKAAARSSQA
ncbi:MAG TPA: 30S ribosomal protein S20 [Actinomycetota bacterium]|jgi:small subunit ribosomal protein S20